MVSVPSEAGVPRTKATTRIYENQDIRVFWDATRCIHTGFCTKLSPAVFDTSKRPWVDVSAADAAEVAATIRACPTSALRYEGLTVPDEQPEEPTTVEVRPNGPVYVRGRFKLVIHGRTVLEDYRVALCRCGASANQPFCDNSHRLVGFRDTAPTTEEVPRT